MEQRRLRAAEVEVATDTQVVRQRCDRRAAEVEAATPTLRLTESTTLSLSLGARSGTRSAATNIKQNARRMTCGMSEPELSGGLQLV